MSLTSRDESLFGVGGTRSGGVFVQQRVCKKIKEEETMLLELRGREAKKKVSSRLWLDEGERRFVVVVDVELKVWKVAEGTGI
jgi:hypothetical protein